MTADPTAPNASARASPAEPIDHATSAMSIINPKVAHTLLEPPFRASMELMFGSLSGSKTRIFTSCHTKVGHLEG